MGCLPYFGMRRNSALMLPLMQASHASVGAQNKLSVKSRACRIVVDGDGTWCTRSPLLRARHRAAGTPLRTGGPVQAAGDAQGPPARVPRRLREERLLEARDRGQHAAGGAVRGLAVPWERRGRRRFDGRGCRGTAGRRRGRLLTEPTRGVLGELLL